MIRTNQIVYRTSIYWVTNSTAIPEIIATRKSKER